MVSRYEYSSDEEFKFYCEPGMVEKDDERRPALMSLGGHQCFSAAGVCSIAE